MQSVLNVADDSGVRKISCLSRSILIFRCCSSTHRVNVELIGRLIDA